MKIWNLIRKDILFCQGWIFAGILLAVVGPVYLLYISELEPVLTETAMFLSTLLACNIVTSRICYVEDNYETKNFLSALPVFRYQFVLARYIEGLVTVIIMTAIVFGLSAFLKMSLHFEMILLFVSLELIYESMYLFFFYRWGSNIAQYALISMAALLGGSYVVLDQYIIPLETISPGPSGAIALVIAGILFYSLSALWSCRHFK